MILFLRVTLKERKAWVLVCYVTTRGQAKHEKAYLPAQSQSPERDFIILWIVVTQWWSSEAVDMNGRFQMQGGKNWFLPKEMNANRFFWDSHWLKIWSNHFYPSMGPNGGSVAMDSGEIKNTVHWGGREVGELWALVLFSTLVILLPINISILEYENHTNTYHFYSICQMFYRLLGLFLIVQSF